MFGWARSPNIARHTVTTHVSERERDNIQLERELQHEKEKEGDWLLDPTKDARIQKARRRQGRKSDSEFNRVRQVQPSQAEFDVALTREP